VNYIRAAYGLLVIVLGAWSVAATLRPAVPIAAQALGVNHEIKPGDLQTPEIAALIHHYLRQPVKPGEPVTSDMVGDRAAVPVIESGFIAVVNVPRTLREQRGIHDGESVQIRSGNQPLNGPGIVRSVTCDENRCAIAIGFDKAPGFDQQALRGADVTEFHAPPARH
jgi:hypothetical protein